MGWFPTWLTPGFVTLVGALLVAIGTFWQFNRQAERSDEIATLNRELAKKSHEIASLAKENLGAATGGDSFAFVNLLNPWHPEGSQVVVIQSGKFPLYDVSVRIVNEDRWNA